MWEINLTEQSTTFLLSILLGAIFCFVFDITRGIRLFGLNSKIAVFFTDIFYFLFISFINFCFFLTRESGQVRGYVFIGEIIGFFIFRLTFSKFIMILLALINKVYKAAKTRIYRVKSKILIKTQEKTLKIKEKVKKPSKNS
ncbi:MAG: spore cortex biosynthesis protein YabQ [Clostridia bacterium]|nr:spore cortex biosynthesis protein YabQ [Clostridia bacterium]